MKYKTLYPSLIIIICLSLFLSGCSPRDVVKEDTDDAFADALREYESEFDPSKYNTPFIIKQEDTQDTDEEPERVSIPDLVEPETPEFIQGFRIQLYSTSDMEIAQDVLAVADSIFTDHWLYIIYEVPFYKVRLGDFVTRPEANRTLSLVIQEGFRDAWIVPDRVIKDPPEKMIEQDVEHETEENIDTGINRQLESRQNLIR